MAPKGEGNSLLAGGKGFKPGSSARQTATVPLRPAYLASFVYFSPTRTSAPATVVHFLVLAYDFEAFALVPLTMHLIHPELPLPSGLTGILPVFRLFFS